MTAQYPANIVTTTNIPNTNPLTTLAANNHSTKHNDMRDEIVAIETYLGKTGSTVAGSVQNILLEIVGVDQAVGKAAVQSITNKTLGTGTKMALGSDATGDTYYNSGSGTVARRGIGSDGQVYTVVSGVPNWQSPTAGNFNYAADTGAANAYVVTLSPALGAYAAGVLVQFKATNANTTASTVNVNGLGVKTIKKLNGSTDLVSGDIAAGMIVELEYDAVSGFFQMLNPVANTVSLTAGVYPAGSGANLTNLPAQAFVSLVVNIPTSSTSVTVTHSLGVIPRYAYIRSSNFKVSTGTSHGVGYATWNNSTGVLVRQNFTGYNLDTNGGVVSFLNTTGGVASVSGSGNGCTASAGNTTSSSFTLTFGAAASGTSTDFYIEVYA